MVANVDTVLAPQSINRLNQSRTVTITGGADDTVSTAEMSQAVQGVLDTFELPDGITYETGGEMEEMINTFTQLAYALVVALGLVYFVLASQFESFVMPVIIMTILPIGLLGSLFTLPLTGNKISMVAFIGVIMLAGTVVNSSIVLIDYMNIRRKRGEDKDTALLNACPRRVRPVLMTTLTTVLGLLPMVFSNGEGAEMMRPMAIVMITGMVVSTIVTLLFTPVYYSLIDSLTQRVRTAGVPAGWREILTRQRRPDTTEEKNDIRGRRRQAILAAATEEFCRNGFEHARMDAIAVRAGIGKSTIYEYFPSKNALLTAVGEQMAERVFVELSGILHSNIAFQDKMISYMRFLTSVLAQMGQKLLILFREDSSMTFFEEMSHQYAEQQYELLEAEVVRAQQAGELRADIDPIVVATLLASLTSTMFKAREVPLESLVDVLMRGMGA